ncbi:MAG: amidohydrolase [Clostridia bacterium]|nr:amidohydrolase [Clostridia bacterium]
MQDISCAVEKFKKLIYETEKYIFNNPETGYKEKKTSKYLEDVFESLGYELHRADGITGFYTVIDTGRKGPEVMILAELDSIICPSHPNADPVTGAAHSCGHNAQCAALVGIAAALKEPNIINKFCGKIRLCAVPAEELLEIEYRRELRAQGVIKYFGGKSEFLYRGYFDGVDIAFMVHTSTSYAVNQGSVGCIAKNITYKGVASHAGGSPWNGKNALYAATCGINAINAIRETFKDSDIIRVHPIITQGGSMVNAIPETVMLESYVRGKSYGAINDANKKVDRALCGAALSLGTNVEIVDIPGYSPLVNDRNMVELCRDAAARAIPQYKFTVCEDFGSGSTDMGDLSAIMPVVHPYAAGAEGNSHGNNYRIVDVDAACVDNAKWQLAMLLLLLEGKAERAYNILDEFKPLFPSKEEFLAYTDSLNNEGDRISYGDDGCASVRL